MEGADHGDRVLAHEEGARVEGEEEHGRLFGEPEARAADRRDLAKLDRNRHAQHGNVDGTREGSAHELRRRPDLLKAREPSAKRGGTLASSQNGRRMLVRPAKAARPSARTARSAPISPSQTRLARAEARALVLGHAEVLKPRRGVLVEAEQGEGHAGSFKRPRRATKRFADAELGGWMADADDARRSDARAPRSRIAWRAAA